MIVTTKHVFDVYREFYPWDIFPWLYEGQTEYGISLDFKNTNITHLPDNMVVHGDLNLDGTHIARLPDNLTVRGYLGLYGNTELTELPRGLTVDQFINIRGCNIVDLPDDLYVGGCIYAGDRFERFKSLYTISGTRIRIKDGIRV